MKLSDIVGMIVIKTDVSSKGDILLTLEGERREGKKIIKVIRQVIAHQEHFFDEDGMFVELDQ